MITKDQLAAVMMKECDICVHLHGKLAALGPAALEYRPSPAQRSTLELLRYLAICSIAGMRCMAAKDWKLFGEFSGRVQAMTSAEFPAAMARQKAEIGAFFAGLTEQQLETQEGLLPTGNTAPLGVAVLGGPFQWLVAYKLQLFLYAKAAGATEIGTGNAWAGIDWKRT